MDSIVNILNPVHLRKLAENWILEDVPNFDLSAFVATDEVIEANIFCKSTAILAGIPFVKAVFEQLNCQTKWHFKEGLSINVDQKPIIVGTVRGQVSSLLLGERTILNVLSRCSGVATNAYKLKMKLENVNWNGFLAGTRKTTPGFRIVEKYGLHVAGICTHRYDLSNMLMLKDNHIEVCNGSIVEAVNRAKKVSGFANKIEVECRNHQEAIEAARTDVDIIMLDNFSVQQTMESSKAIKDIRSNVLIEVSGGITEMNLVKYAMPTVDIISMSSLVQGYPCVDYSMKI